MMIVPIHQRLHWGNIPWMSVAIALICIWIFAIPQQRDNVIYDEAVALYETFGLKDIEEPLYRVYAEGHPEAYIHSFEETEDGSVPPDLLQWDRGFRDWLSSGNGFASKEAAAAWRDQSHWFDEKIASAWNERYAMRSEAPTVFQSLSTSFLHGSWDHLFGNLMFLLILGLLVEKALGPWLYAALYLACGIAASWLWAVTSAPWMTAVGASGAISGLMGAMCVLWGLRKVRFFYWFIVVFDYVRAPAVLLLVPWLGWEFWQWATDEGSGIAYSAHAGGMIAGAALAGVVKALRWERPNAYEETLGTAKSREEHVAELRATLGRLDVGAAEALLEPLLSAHPADAEIGTLALRAAMMARKPALAAQRAVSLVQARVPAIERDRVIAILEDWRRSGGAWEVKHTFAYARLLLQRGRAEQAAAELAAAAEVTGAEMAGEWLRLAFEREREGDSVGARTLLDALVGALPETPEAAKARAALSA